MTNATDFTRAPWSVFPTDVTSPLPAQRSGSSDRQDKADYAPAEKQADRPNVAPRPAKREQSAGE
jgi:hypothetical protein